MSHVRTRLGLAAILALSVSCGAPPTVGERPSAAATAPTTPGANPSAGVPVLRLRLSTPSIPAGGCAVAIVTAGEPIYGRVEIERAGRSSPEATVRLLRGRARTRLCEGWTSGGPFALRAVAPGLARPSTAVPLEVRSAPWMIRIEDLLGALPVSVSVANGTSLYEHLGEVPRAPASNEKLLLSMALLDRFGPGYRIPTSAEARRVSRRVVRGDLWLTGHGDPEVGPARIAGLALAIRAAGIRSVRGSVVGDRSAFTRERWAPGWHPIALRFIGLPTALTFEGNADAGGFVFDPELRAAAALTADLRSLGVRVAGAPATGREPEGLSRVAAVRSAPLVDVLRRQNVSSNNLDAEVLDKLLGGAASGPPGSIAKGAAAIETWAGASGVAVVAHDGAGLSYRDRVTADGMVVLLGDADRAPWGAALRSTLPTPGEGTLEGRLRGLRVRAKTGTLLQGVSALSGWVWLRRERRWAEFSILSKGLSKAEAVRIEDTVVRIVATQAQRSTA